jgi:hypothetical protein
MRVTSGSFGSFTGDDICTGARVTHSGPEYFDYFASFVMTFRNRGAHILSVGLAAFRLIGQQGDRYTGNWSIPADVLLQPGQRTTREIEFQPLPRQAAEYTLEFTLTAGHTVTIGTYRLSANGRKPSC